MNRLLLVLLFLPGCMIGSEFKYIAKSLPEQLGAPDATVHPAYQDLRDPKTRKQVDDMIADNARKDQTDPMPSPPSVFDKEVPNTFTVPEKDGESCDMPGMADPTPMKSGPAMLDAQLMEIVRANAIPGVPDWMDLVQLLECDIEAPLPKERVSGWSTVPGEPKRWIVGFDRDGDGNADANIELGQGDVYPRYYAFDRTFNGEFNIIYEDTRQDGTCGGIFVVASKKDETPKLKGDT